MRKFNTGDKVVPINKSIYGDLSLSVSWKEALEAGQNYLYVIGWDIHEECYICSDCCKIKSGDFFLESDLIPYGEQSQKETLPKITLLHHTPIEVIAKATAMPYQSKPTNKLVKNVWDSNHRSIARHGMATFLIEGVSQSLLRQLSRHPHLSLTVKSTRYCDMTDANIIVPQSLRGCLADQKDYMNDMDTIMGIYSKWKGYEDATGTEDISKLFLPLASTTDLVVSGNYQALYEFLQLRNCTRVEFEIRSVSLQLTKILKEIMPDIFVNLGCRGDEYRICPEAKDACGKHPLKKDIIK